MREYVSTSSQKCCEYSHVKGVLQKINSESNDFIFCVLQVIWCPGPCTTSSHCTSRTPAMALRSTRRPPTPQCTGSPRPFTPCVTSCTARRWSGRTPTWSPPKSPYRLRGESDSKPGNDAGGSVCTHHIISLVELNISRVKKKAVSQFVV